MHVRVRLIRGYPSSESGKPKPDRKRWSWYLRWHEPGDARRGDSIGYWAGPRDDGRPKDNPPRLTVKEAERIRKLQHAVLGNENPKPRALPWAEFVEQYIGETRGTVKGSTLKAIREALTIFGRIGRSGCAAGLVGGAGEEVCAGKQRPRGILGYSGRGAGVSFLASDGRIS